MEDQSTNAIKDNSKKHTTARGNMRTCKRKLKVLRMENTMKMAKKGKTL